MPPRRSVPRGRSLLNAVQATEAANQYVEQVLRRQDLIIEEVERDDGEWVVVLEGLAQAYELRLDATTGEVMQFTRVDD